MYSYFYNPPPSPLQNIAIHFYLNRETNDLQSLYSTS